MYTVCGKNQPVCLKCFCDWSTEFGRLHILFNLAAVFCLLESNKIFTSQAFRTTSWDPQLQPPKSWDPWELSYTGYAGLRYFITSYRRVLEAGILPYWAMDYGNSKNTVYLTRDYYDGFINDRVKYGSGKIWRNRSKPTTFSRSLFYRCPTFQLQNSKILFRM